MRQVNNYLKLSHGGKLIDIWPFDADLKGDAAEAMRKASAARDFYGGRIAAYRYFWGMPADYRIVGEVFEKDAAEEGTS